MLLAIDPGRDTGWCFLGNLGEPYVARCGLGDPPVEFLAPGDLVIIERPQVYRDRSSKGDPNDLITLAIQVGRYTERCEALGAKVEHVLPREWKGTVDPDVLCHRVTRALSESERELLYTALAPLARKPMTTEHLTSGKRHNVIDAVGIAKWAVSGRLPARFTRC
jgi:hypothetical protein